MSIIGCYCDRSDHRMKNNVIYRVIFQNLILRIILNNRTYIKFTFVFDDVLLRLLDE